MSEKIRFDSLPLSEGIQAAVKEMGFEYASPIQSEAIPFLLRVEMLLVRRKQAPERPQHLVYPSLSILFHLRNLFKRSFYVLPVN